MELPVTPCWRRPPASLFLLEEVHVGSSYVGWLNDPAVNQFLESRFTTQTQESTRDFVKVMRARSDVLLLGIHDDELQRHVGNIKLGPIDRHHGLGEIGLMIGDRAAWGRGLGSAAISSVTEIAHQQLGLRKLTAGCYAANTGSRKAFEKAGFHVEGVRPAHFLVDGQPEDLILLGRTFEKRAKNDA